MSWQHCSCMLVHTHQPSACGSPAAHAAMSGKLRSTATTTAAVSDASLRRFTALICLHSRRASSAGCLTASLLHSLTAANCSAAASLHCSSSALQPCTHSPCTSFKQAHRPLQVLAHVASGRLPACRPGGNTLCGPPDPPSDKYKKSQRTAAGADKWLDTRLWDSTVDCLGSLSAAGYQVITTHLSASSITIQVRRCWRVMPVCSCPG